MMTKLHNASDFVKCAVEGGYPKEKTPWCQECAEDIFRFLCDPLAWQAVGKARGWGEGTQTNPFKFGYFDKYDKNGVLHGELLWEYWAARWFHVRMSGGDEKSFWESLP